MNNQNNYNTADKAYFINNYRNSKKQVTKTSLHIAFNKRCRKHSIIPTHTQTTIKQNTHGALQTKRKAEKIHLNNIINHLYHKKDTLNRHAYNLHIQFTQILHHIELQKFNTTHTRQHRKTQIDNTRSTQQKNN